MSENFFEYVVTEPMAVGVVDCFKAIDIAHRDTDILPDVIEHVLIQRIAVLQPGDAVVIGDDLQRFVEQIRLVFLRDIVDGQTIVKVRIR